MRKTIRNMRTYIWHVLPVFLVACLMVAVLTPVYMNTKRQAEKTVTRALETQLQSDFEAVLGDLDTAKSILDDARYLDATLALSRMDDDALRAENYLSLYHMKKAVSNLSKYDMLQQTVLMQFRSNRTLILDGSLYADKRAGYGGMFGFDALSYDEWQRKLFEETEYLWPAMSGSFGARAREEWITFNTYYSPRLATSVVTSVLVPVSAFAARFLPAQERENCLFYLTDGRDMVLYDAAGGFGPDMARMENGDLLRAGQEEYLVFSQANGDARFGVAIGVPRSILYASVQPVMNMIFLLIVLALACAALYCALYAYVYFRPMVRLVEDLDASPRGDLPERSLYARLRRVLASMSSEQERLRRESGEVKRQMDDYVLRRAVSGAVLSATETETLARLPVFSGEYAMVIVEYRDVNPEGRRLFFTRARKLLPEAALGVQEADRMLALFPSGPLIAPEALDALFAELVATGEQRVHMAVSHPYAGIPRVNAAWREADHALFHMKMSARNAVGRFDGEKAPPEAAFVPFQKYIGLNECLTGGDRTGVDELFREFREALTDERMTPDSARQALENIRETLASAAFRLDAGEIAPAPEDALPLNRLEHLRGAALSLCDAVIARRGNRRSEQAREIMRFIEENFTDSNFSLLQIADRFGLSEKYVSQFLKKQTGQTCSAHVEEMRMLRAKQLLLTTHMTVDEIAGAVGYEYRNTFYKAFKRFFGQVPNEVRGENSRQRD